MPRANLGFANQKKFNFNLDNLTRHTAIVGTTGSGKTVMGKILLEEALVKGIPVIAIDPKGDIGSLGIISPSFDFRPFSQGTKNSEKLASVYTSYHKKENVNIYAKSLTHTDAKIYTPKAKEGISLNMMPDLTCPKNIAKLNEQDISSLAESVSESVLNLASFKSSKKDKATSLLTAIIFNCWHKRQNLSLTDLINLVIEPPFKTVGSLPLDDFLKESDRKSVAASLNLILSSPSKIAWQNGNPIDIKKMFSKNKLSVVDLRFTGNSEDKQYAVERILQNIYMYLINKGGKQKLSYILYIDELAGLLPLPPATSPCKKLLELLIRQARAFGLGVILATQSPGDLDYRLFGNLGTRFVGKLRTQREIEKVALAMNIEPSVLANEVSSLSTGEFLFNDAVSNKTKLLQARWLYTYHSGPLNAKQISWINNPSKKPLVTGSLKISKVKQKIIPKTKKTQSIVTSNKIKQKRTTKKIAQTELTSVQILIKSIQRFADKVQVKVGIGSQKEYVPHLKILITPKKINNLNLPPKGPYVFDLTTKLIPIGNYLKDIHWSSYYNSSIKIKPKKQSIEKVFQYSISDAIASLKCPYFESTIFRFASTNQKEVIKANEKYLEDYSSPKIERIKNSSEINITSLKRKMSENKKIMLSIGSKAGLRLAQNTIKKILSLKGQKKSSAYKKEITKLNSVNIRIIQKIKKIEKNSRKEIVEIKNKNKLNAINSIHQKKFTPSKKDILINATLLLVPKRLSEI